MSRALIVLNSKADRERAAKWAWGVPWGSRIEFKETKRSLPQNARMWSMLTEVSLAVEYHGLKLSADDWKLIFLDALKHEVRMVPNLNNNGFVSLGRSSSDLTKGEMSDLMELIAAFGAEHGVKFADDEVEAA
jgi:hypothetical protein